MTAAQQDEAGAYFDSEVSPALTPLVFDPAHPFPFLSNLSTSLAFLLHDPEKAPTSYARVKVPPVLKQWVAVKAEYLPAEDVLVPLYEVIRGNVHKLYGGMRLSGTTLFRVTRDAEVEIDDESDEALQDLVREQVRQRRYEPVVRLEFAPGADPRHPRDAARTIRALRRRTSMTCPKNWTTPPYSRSQDLPLPALRDPAWTPLPPAAFEHSPDIFAAIRAGDVLVHHPYESFEDSVEHFIAAAADDPRNGRHQDDRLPHRR